MACQARRENRRRRQARRCAAPAVLLLRPAPSQPLADRGRARADLCASCFAALPRADQARYEAFPPAEPDDGPPRLAGQGGDDSVGLGDLDDLEALSDDDEEDDEEEDDDGLDELDDLSIRDATPIRSRAAAAEDDDDDDADEEGEEDEEEGEEDDGLGDLEGLSLRPATAADAEFRKIDASSSDDPARSAPRFFVVCVSRRWLRCESAAHVPILGPSKRSQGTAHSASLRTMF